jgi:hypothetical protein
MSFGRKGVGAGGAGGAMARPARPLVAASPASTQPKQQSASPFAEPGSDIAAKREAFIATERARKAQSAGDTTPATAFEDSVSPAQPRARFAAGATERPSWTPSPEAVARVKNSASRSGSSLPYAKFLGHPADRSISLAYVYWYFCGAISMHRIYCGSLETAMYQFSLLFISLVCLALFPPLGIAGFLGWILWLIVDLFLIPGMMRRNRERHARGDEAIFE